MLRCCSNEFAYHSTGQLLSGKEAVTNWYNEVQQYNFAQPGFSAAAGHFTQVVWKASTKMGIGRAKYTNGEYMLYYQNFLHHNFYNIMLSFYYFIIFYFIQFYFILFYFI